MVVMDPRPPGFSSRIVLNFTIEKGLWCFPILAWRKNIGPREVARIAKAISAQTGATIGSAASTSATSKQRFARDCAHRPSGLVPGRLYGAISGPDEFVLVAAA